MALAKGLVPETPPEGPTDAVPRKRNQSLMAWLLWENVQIKVPDPSPHSSDDEHEDGEVLRSTSAGRLPSANSHNFQRAFFRAYVEKHRADPTHLGTVLPGSCPFVQADISVA